MASNLKNLLSYQDIPKWQQSNRYLLSGYRYVASRLRSHRLAASNLAFIPNPLIAFSAPSGSALTSLASALHLNNETINIHTHLAGGFVFALLPIYFHLAFDPPLADTIVVSIFLEGVATCFLLSAL
jgi:predicted membrane channel-forming protein YqfA (hemolysin III family)